jgi:sporulation protein YlmC with PRC-barrel domain
MTTSRALEQANRPRVWEASSRGVRRLSRLKGMPVIDLLKAQRVGKVRNVYLDPAAGRIAALDVGPHGEFKKAHIAGRHVRRIGHQAIVLLTAQDIGDESMLGAGAIDVRTLIGLQAITDEGDRVGVVSDVYLNPDTLAVDAYELRTPPLTRSIKGPQLIMPARLVICSQELMIVTPAGRELAQTRVDQEAEPAAAIWRHENLRVLSPSAAAISNHREPGTPAAPAA